MNFLSVIKFVKHISAIRLIKIALLFFSVMLLFNCSSDIIKDDADWSFIALGDIRSGYGIYNQHAKTIAQIRPIPEFVMILGDMISEGGNDLEWLKFFNSSKPITNITKMYTVAGNHDVDSVETEELYKEQVGEPSSKLFFSFKVRDVLFIVLDTVIPGEGGEITGEQHKWLINSLKTATDDSTINKIIFFMHHPFYPQGRHRGDNLKNGDELHTEIESFDKVKLIVESHEHQFFHYKENRIDHLITGGGGAPIYDDVKKGYFHFTKVGFYEKENRINIKTIGTFGEVIEDFDL